LKIHRYVARFPLSASGIPQDRRKKRADFSLTQSWLQNQIRKPSVKALRFPHNLFLNPFSGVSIMQPNLVYVATTASIVVIGMTVLWYLKWDRNPSDVSFESFFVGGGKVGETLTANNNWGLCFAFANAVWYYAFLGYYYGPWTFLLQVPWSVAVILLSRKLSLYIAASHSGTVHGFIEHRYGARAALVAAVATLIGYTINIGFELFYSAFLLCVGLGIPELGFIVSMFLAIFVAGYCVAGGYLGNVRTDRFQNLLGFAAVVFLIVALMPKFYSATGSWNAFSTAGNFSAPPWHFVLGVATFAFLFNFVDMANWQSLAANRNLSKADLANVGRGLFWSAVVQMIAPAFVGCWLGVILKALKGDLADDQYFNFAFSNVFGDSLTSAILLGIVVFGLLGITISSAGSYLLASMQTLAVDIVWRRELEKSSGKDENLQRAVLRWTRHNLMFLSLASVAVFASMYYGLSKFGVQGLAFQFQFVMYGVAVTLVPCVIEALLALHSQRSVRISANSALFSICAGLTAVLIPFFIAATVWDLPAIEVIRLQYGISVSGDAIINLTPVFGFLIAAITCLILSKAEKKNEIRI
jgi:Na+/proline symporter